MIYNVPDVPRLSPAEIERQIEVQELEARWSDAMRREVRRAWWQGFWCFGGCALVGSLLLAVLL